MNIVRFIRIAALLASTLLVTAASAAPKELEEAMSHDGLQKIKVKNIDLAYARPGASLAGYNSVKLEPVDVAFRKDWNPTRTGSLIKLSTAERENIRTSVAKIVFEEFTRELQARSGYKVVAEAGPDVLRVKASVVNLYVNAPDVPTAGRTRSYVVSAGQMTLFAELFDSETGQVLARVVDHREAQSNGGMMSFSNSVMNRAEAETIASAWARILRDRLDAAHGIGKK